mmetsp:Transcript_101271/g.185488  ORF Transcript_101271/g.185488 Transcript_101271/m.185488 type:complete len:1482 (-) Transcript_101271:52-4497(-)
MSAPDQASPRVMETAADAESPEKTPAQRTEGYDATTRRMLMGTSDHPEQKKHKSPHRGAEAGLVRDDDDDESQAKRGGRVRHDSIMITAPRSHPEQGGGYAEAYKRIRAEEEAEQAREAEALGIDNADILNPHLISHSRTDDRRRQLASTGTSAEESSSDEDDSQESESRRRDKDKRKQPKLSMIEKVRHGCKVGRGWAKWLAKRAWEEVTCHYRKRKIMLEKNEWMTHELKERVERLLIIRKKYREIYQSKAEELKGRAKRKAIPKYQLYWYLLWLRVAYVWHDFYAFASNLLGFVHRGTGLPLSVMEWYHFERLLNEGPHGRTYMALDSKGRTVAVKIRDKSRGMVMWLPLKRATYTISWQITPRRFAMIQRVLAHFGLVSMPFDHDHVVKVFAVYDNAEFFVEVSEYMSGGSLLNFCEDVDGAMDEHSVCQVFTRILLALQYMHGRRILHRDLRLSQILLARSMRLDEVKLSDFWFMTRVPAKSFLNENSLPGDVATRAPEVILRGEWSIKADIWSAGCVLFELLFGHPPFGGHGEALVDRICRQGPEFDVLCGKISDGAMDLLRLCLKRSVAHRPTAKTLLQHRWFREYGGDRKAKSKQSLAERLNKRARRIRRVAIYGKEAAHRRGLPPRNLLAAKSGMFNSGFCTPMGLTKCTIDLIVGDKDEESMDRRQYWVKTIMVSLWGSQDNPRKIVAYGAQRPNIPWVQLAEHSVKSVRAAEARLVIDRPLRFVRLVMTGNFGGIYGIALQKLTMYGFEIVQEPIVFALDKCHYARGAAAHTHREDFKESDLNNLNKVVRESLERGSRIPGTGQRYYVYRDIFSGTPHTTTVAQMYVKMIKGNTICAATLSLRFVAYAPTLSSTPRIRIGVDAEEGRVVMCTTRALPVANWDAEKVCKQGYSDMETLWVTDLNISTDNGFAIELHFENNSGYVHVPADCGLTLYYIPDVAEFSDDSDMDEHQSMSKMARKNRREGVDMGVFEGITQELQEADAVGKEEHEHHHHHHHHHHHGEGHHGEKSDDPLAALRNQEQEEDKVSILSEGQEGLMQDDLKEMEVNIKYGRWGASNFRTGDVEAWYPRWVGHGSQYHEKGAAPSRKSEVPDVEQEEGEEGEEEAPPMMDDEDSDEQREHEMAERWWEDDGQEDKHERGRSSSSEESSSSSYHTPPELAESNQARRISYHSDSSEDSRKSIRLGGLSPRDEAERRKRMKGAHHNDDLEKYEAEKKEKKAHSTKVAIASQEEIERKKEMRAHARAEERKERLYKQLEAAAHVEAEEARLREWEEIAEHWQDKGHKLNLDPKPVVMPEGGLAVPQTPGTGRMSMLTPGSGGTRQNARSSTKRAGGMTIFGGDKTQRDKIEERIAELESRRKRGATLRQDSQTPLDHLDWLCPAGDQPFCSNAYEKLQTKLPAMLLPFTPPVPPSTPRVVRASTGETSGEQSKPKVPELELGSGAPSERSGKTSGSEAAGKGTGAANGCSAM